jgi:hypothetical protein
VRADDGPHQPHPEARFLASCKRLQVRTIEALGTRPRLVWTIDPGQRHRRRDPVADARSATACRTFARTYLIAHAGLRPGISLAETARVGRSISRELAAIPGVKSVAEQIGRAENGQDPDTPDRSEFEVQIDPKRGLTAAQIDSAIRKVFDNYPNQLVEIYSVLAERIGETLSGESAPFSISVFGADLDTDDAVAAQIADALRKLPDSGNVRLIVPAREPQLHLELKPVQLALHGLQAEDVLETINAAFHGSVVAQLSQADRSVPVAVRIEGAAADPHRGRSRCCCAAAMATVVPLSARGDARTALAAQHRQSPGRIAPADRRRRRRRPPTRPATQGGPGSGRPARSAAWRVSCATAASRRHSRRARTSCCCIRPRRSC